MKQSDQVGTTIRHKFAAVTLSNSPKAIAIKYWQTYKNQC